MRDLIPLVFLAAIGWALAPLLTRRAPQPCTRHERVARNGLVLAGVGLAAMVATDFSFVANTGLHGPLRWLSYVLLATSIALALWTAIRARAV